MKDGCSKLVFFCPWRSTPSGHCPFPNTLVTERNLDSITSIILAVDTDFGKVIHNNENHSMLQETSIFFITWIYVPLAGTHLYHELEPMPISGFNLPSWPLLDMSILKVFRVKSVKNFKWRWSLALALQGYTFNGLCHWTSISLPLPQTR